MLPHLPMKPSESIRRRIVAAGLLLSQILWTPSAQALRYESTSESAGVRQLRRQLVSTTGGSAEFTTGGSAELTTGAEETALEPARLREALRRFVPLALTRGLLLPNSVAHNQVDHRVGVDTTDLPGAGFQLIRVLDRDFWLTPLVPDPRVHKLPRRYVAETDPEKARKRLLQNSPDFKTLMVLRPTLPLLPEQVARSKARGLEVIRLALAALGEPGEPGRTPQERAAAQAVRAAVWRMAEISPIYIKAVDGLSRQERAGKVPVKAVQEAMGAIRAGLGAWPHLQEQIRAFLEELPPPEGTISKGECIGFVGDLRDQLAGRNVSTLLEEAGAEPLQRVYYDAFRATLRERLQRVRGALEAADSPEALRPAGTELETLVTLTLAVELEEELTRLMAETAKGAAGAERMVFASQGAGFLCLNERMEPVRFVPGGGSEVETSLMAGRFPAHPIREWAGGYPAVVLIYPTFSGRPGLDQIDLFFKDIPSLRRALGPAPELLLGAAQEDGSMAVYRPLASLGDPAAWGRGYRVVWRALKRYDRFAQAVSDRIGTAPGSSGAVGFAAGSMGRAVSAGLKMQQDVGWVRNTADRLPEILQAELVPVIGTEVAGRIMEAVRDRFREEFRVLKSVKFGQPNSREWVKKIHGTQAEVHGVGMRSLLSVGEELAEPLMPELFAPLDLPWAKPPAAAAPAQAPEEAPVSPEAKPAGPQGIGPEVVEKLVGQALSHRVIAPDEELALRSFILQVWAPSRQQSGSYPFPRMKEAWEQAKKERAAAAERAREMATLAEAERAKAEAAAREQAARAEAERRRKETEARVQDELRWLGEVVVADAAAVREELARSLQILREFGDPADEEAARRLQSGRERLAGRFADEFVLQVEIELDLESGGDTAPQRIGPLLARVRAEALPVVEEFPEVAAGLAAQEDRLRRAVEEARRKAARPALSRQELRKAEDDILRGSGDPLEIVAVLRSPRFETILASESAVGRFLDRVEKGGGKQHPANTERVRNHAQRELGRGISGDPALLYQAVIRLADLLPRGEDSAGLEERPGPQRVEAAAKGVEEIVRRWKERSAPGYGRQVVVVGPSIHEGAVPFLGELIERALSPVSGQLFLDPSDPAERVKARAEWAGGIWRRYPGELPAVLFLGSDEEFAHFQGFVKSVLFKEPRRPADFPRNPAECVVELLQWLGLPQDNLSEGERLRLREGLQLLIQA